MFLVGAPYRDRLRTFSKKKVQRILIDGAKWIEGTQYDVSREEAKEVQHRKCYAKSYERMEEINEKKKKNKIGITDE